MDEAETRVRRAHRSSKNADAFIFAERQRTWNRLMGIKDDTSMYRSAVPTKIEGKKTLTTIDPEKDEEIELGDDWGG